jgi:gamma-glutamylcyclotransferase (GGCT)/AIG2-like uncharacterized protein YtfP
MKKNKKKKPVKISLNQEEAEVFMSEVHLCEELKKRDNVRTPDFLDLKLQDHHFLFVYGTLMMGERLSAYLDGCPFLGDARTSVKNFNMSISKVGSFPIIFSARTISEKATSSHVCGEVYVVDPKTLAEIDVLESNGKMYEREKVWVWMEDHLRPAEQCWVYVGNPNYWQGRDIVGYPFKIRNQVKLLEFDQETAKQLTRPQDPPPFSNVWNNWVQEEINNTWPM